MNKNFSSLINARAVGVYDPLMHNLKSLNEGFYWRFASQNIYTSYQWINFLQNTWWTIFPLL